MVKSSVVVAGYLLLAEASIIFPHPSMAILSQQEIHEAFPAQAHESECPLGDHLRQGVEGHFLDARAGPGEHRDKLLGCALPGPPSVVLRLREAEEHLGLLLVAEHRQRFFSLAGETVDENLYPSVLVVDDQPVGRAGASDR